MDLSRAPHSSVARLAGRHGVSERTIQRDLAALNEIGVPVWTRTGPGGGVGLVEGWRSPLTGMTSAQMRALVMGEAASRDLGMLADFEVARLILLGVPSSRPDAVASARDRILVDNRTWFTESGPPSALPVVARAVWSGRRISLSYQRPGAASPAARTVDPLGLVLKTDTWYLVAARGIRIRTYRVSRISSCDIGDEPVRRPSDFSLSEYWARSRDEFESAVATRPVRLTLPSEAVEDLRRSVPGPATGRALGTALDAAVGADGRLEVELPMQREPIAVAQLLTVPDVEVLEPVDLRESLAARARAIAARNTP